MTRVKFPRLLEFKGTGDGGPVPPELAMVPGELSDGGVQALGLFQLPRGGDLPLLGD